MEPEPRRPMGWLLLAVVAAVLGAAQVVALVVWMVMSSEPGFGALLAVPWLLLWYVVALGAIRAARREPGLPR